MSKGIEFEIPGTQMGASAGYSGNPFDPARIRWNNALGSFGAIPPYFVPDTERIATTDYDDIPMDRPTAGELRDSDKNEYARTSSYTVIRSLMPLKLKRISDSSWFEFPIEPLVTVSGKNTIVRRSVVKAGASRSFGSVKERWSGDDFDIQIQGVFSADADRYPHYLIERLLTLYNERRSVEVLHEQLNNMGIFHIAIESISLPHTKGIRNQNFEIKAYSDNSVDLLIEI